MTVFTPTKTNNLNIFIYFSIALFILISGLWLFVYSQQVVMRHNLVSFENNLKDVKVKNAELKDNLYNLLNPANLSDLASSLNLIKDQDPNFLHVAQN